MERERPAIVDAFVSKLEQAVHDAPESLLPDGLFNTFEFTRTGKNHAHSRVWGLATKAAWEGHQGGVGGV